MAELIPVEYRIRVARAALVSRWSTLLIITVAVAAVALLQTYMWRRKQAAEFARLTRQCQDNAVFLTEYNDLRARRDDLAGRMKKMEDLQGDKVLLALLTGVSGGFAESDSLEFLRVVAHPADVKPADARYSVRIRGITANDTSHSRFLERLTQIGKSPRLPLIVPLGEKHLTTLLDGEVTSFDITCEQPLVKAN